MQVKLGRICPTLETQGVCSILPTQSSPLPPCSLPSPANPGAHPPAARYSGWKNTAGVGWEDGLIPLVAGTGWSGGRMLA